jgi:chemotaxis signal transduction protein
MIWQARSWSLTLNKNQQLHWLHYQGELLPLFDANQLLTGSPTSHHDDVMVLRHSDAEQRFHTVGLRLHHKPELIYVQDEQQCALPDDNPRWSSVALSCVQLPQGVVPIIDPTLLFAAMPLHADATPINVLNMIEQ